MSLGQYLTDRLAGMQFDCPVLPAPACPECSAEHDAAMRCRLAEQMVEVDELAAVAVLSNN